MIELSNFIDKIVKHKKWGPGVVKTITDESITVFFENTEAGARTVPFQFPQAFNAGHLAFEDAKLTEKVQEIISQRACSFCHDTTKNTKVVDGLRVCDKCEREHVIQCGSCRKPTIKDNATQATWNATMYTRVHLCPNCLRDKAFRCEDCNTVYSKEAFREKIFGGKKRCSRCFSFVASECCICGKAYKYSDGEETYTYNQGYVQMCDECLDTHAFKCSICDSYRILEDRFISSTIAAESNVCVFCTTECACCGETITKNDAHTYDDKKYCSACWEKHSRACKICENEFIPASENECLCPGCVESKAYEKRLKKLDLPGLPYKQLKYCQLDYLDRCKLFTELYSFCEEDFVFQLGKREGEPFKYIVLDIYGRKVVITYLSKEVIGKVMYSENVTMTEFRSQKGRFKVYAALDEWKDTSTTVIELPAGRMKILNYPVLLRVQTSYDKNYGKEWNGPDDYIEIGNYGDTTDFYIVGLLSDKRN